MFVSPLWLRMVLNSTRLHLEWLKFAEIPPSRGCDTTLQGPASRENNGATGAAQPCSEMRPAPHCLRGKVRKPSLEFKRLHNRPRLAYPALSRLRPPALARPSSFLNFQAESSLSLWPALCSRQQSAQLLKQLFQEAFLVHHLPSHKLLQSRVCFNTECLCWVLDLRPMGPLRLGVHGACSGPSHRRQRQNWWHPTHRHALTTTQRP